MKYKDQHLDDETIRSAPGDAPSPRKDELIGATIDDRYRIMRKLGRGGFGTVYLAADEKMAERKVVLKVMHAEEARNEWSAKKFKHEIEALTRITHPNIVAIYDCGVTGDQPYIVMQHINGIPLRALITPEGMQPWRAAKLINQIGRALTAAHEAGILHRDLKPENVMVENVPSDDEQVKVIDFGVAKVKDSLMSSGSTRDQSLIGTIAYMSPEQLSAQKVTPTSDIYSLGIIAYEMLTGRRPTTPDSAFQLLELQRSGVRVKPSDLRPSLSAEVDTIVVRALAFNPGERFRRARDFGDQLSEALLDGQVQTEPPAPAEKIPTGPLSETLTPETAHVLFLDIAGYTGLLMDQQQMRFGELQQIVSDSPECRSASKENLTRLTTGDGMALVFHGDPEAPVRCAVDISRALQGHPEISARMGVHSGLVYRVADINTNMNVAGGGIRTAQRIMNCGEQGHILLSKRVADDLTQLSRWSGYIHSFGEIQMSPGQSEQIFSLYGEEFGNPSTPVPFQRTVTDGVSKKPLLAAAAIVSILVIGIGFALWYALRPGNRLPDQPLKVAAADVVGPEHTLSYWLTVQKVFNNREQAKPFDSANDIAFGNGWKFHFNLRPQQPGALYLLNVGPDKNGGEEFDILFPVPKDKEALRDQTPLDPHINADQLVQLPPAGNEGTSWYQFVDHNGVEKLWLIWSTKPIAELDRIFAAAARNKGVVSGAEQLGTIQKYIEKYQSSPPEITSDKEKEVTLVKGRGEILVNLVELKHKDY